MSRYQSLGLEAGPAVHKILSHERDPRVLEQFEVTLHVVRVDSAKLPSAVLVYNLRYCIASLTHTWGTVRAHLEQNQQFAIIFLKIHIFEDRSIMYVLITHCMAC